MNRGVVRQVLDCASARALSDLTGSQESGRALPHSRTLVRLRQYLQGSWPPIASFSWAKWITMILFIALVPMIVLGATPEEDRLFETAAKAYNDGLLERANRELDEFIRLYPASERFSQAVLYQAQARFKLGLYEAVVQSLQKHQERAGDLADQYRFWAAEAHFYQSNYTAAATGYAQLVKDFSQSSLCPRAIFGEALALYRLGSYTNAIAWLKQPDGAFQTLAKAHPENEYVHRGQLLLGEMLIDLKSWPEAEQLLASLPLDGLSPGLEWQRQSLLMRTKLENQRPAEALAHVTNLITLAEGPSLRARHPEAVAWRGEILQRLNQIEPAIEAFQRNLGEAVPAAYRRQALLKIIDLNTNRNRPDQAVQSMSQLIQAFPQDPDMDQWLLRLGEFYLSQFQLLPKPAGQTNEAEIITARTNLLQLAQSRFDQIITQFTNSPRAGVAWLNRGWCLWQTGRILESQAAFQTAAGLLPPGQELIRALLNCADTQYQLGDLAGAATNYQALIARTNALQLAPGLVRQAQFQLVQVNVDRKDAAQARSSLDQLLASTPDHAQADQAMLLVAQLLNRLGQPAETRKILDQLISRFPQSNLLPDAKLVMAKAFDREQKWQEALDSWTQWIQAYSNHPALSQAMFYRAQTYDKAGQSSNALVQLTNFVAQFSTNPLAPQAQNWVGDFFFNQALSTNEGLFAKAEENYQILYQKWPQSELAYPARLMAGRSAFLRKGLDDAIGYFTNLINDAKCPPNVVAEAYFNYGDVLMIKLTTNLTARYENAITAFGKIPQLYPTNPLVPLAWGKIGECYLQLATQDTNHYRNATTNFYRVLESKSPQADWPSRCQAEAGLAWIDEKIAQTRAGDAQTALLNSALDHYLNVLYEKTRGPDEPRSPFWLEKAGLEAARIAELRQQWQQAANLYARLKELLPAKEAVFERKREAALQKAASSSN